MPLNSHSYLVAQGWQGTGEALREGAISRPVIVTQKKTLAGVGKDRDEAFPFWDHVFTAAATSIKVKLYNDDGDEDSDIPQPSGSSTPLDRTSTGIISNKPRKVGLLAFTSAASEATGLSVMALAKRESARRGLYSRFFRGPVLGPDTEEPQVPEVVQRSPPFRPGLSDPTPSVSVMEKRKGKKRKSREEDEEVGMAQKKRKPKREKRRLGKEAKKGEAYERRSHDEVGAGLMEELIALEGSVKDGDTAGYSRKKDRKKKRKRDESDDTVYHRSSWVLE